LSEARVSGFQDKIEVHEISLLSPGRDGIDFHAADVLDRRDLNFLVDLGVLNQGIGILEKTDLCRIEPSNQSLRIGIVGDKCPDLLKHAPDSDKRKARFREKIEIFGNPVAEMQSTARAAGKIELIEKRTRG
jgi:hypothetical protein